MEMEALQHQSSSCQLLTQWNMLKSTVLDGVIYSPAGSLFIIIIRTGAQGDRGNILSQWWKYLLICPIILNRNVFSLPFVLTGNAKICFPRSLNTGWRLCVQTVVCANLIYFYDSKKSFLFSHHTWSQKIKRLSDPMEKRQVNSFRVV